MYSRDGVSGALQLQESIISSVQKGWRPHTPLGRGGQIPIPEQSFTLEKFKKDADDHQWAFFSFHQKQAFEADLFDSGDLENASDSSSSTDSSESSSSTQEKNSESKTHRAVPGSFDEATMGLFRKTWHVVMNSPPEGDLPPDWHWATACGRRFSPQHFTIHDELDLIPGQVLCTHPGCKKGWVSVGILT